MRCSVVSQTVVLCLPLSFALAAGPPEASPPPDPSSTAVAEGAIFAGQSLSLLIYSLNSGYLELREWELADKLRKWEITALFVPGAQGHGSAAKVYYTEDGRPALREFAFKKSPDDLMRLREFAENKIARLLLGYPQLPAAAPMAPSKTAPVAESPTPGNPVRPSSPTATGTNAEAVAWALSALRQTSALVQAVAELPEQRQAAARRFIGAALSGSPTLPEPLAQWAEAYRSSHRD